MKKRGFTLAEVLITLGIIGVIAALTAPALVQNTGSAKVGPTLAKVVSTMENANQQILTELEINSLYSIGQADKSLLDKDGGASEEYRDSLNSTMALYCEELVKHIHKSSYEYTTTDKIWTTGIGVRLYDGTDAEKPSASRKCVVFHFPDNVDLLFADWRQQTSIKKGSYLGQFASCLIVDINGFGTKPNTLGKDLFYFDLDNNGAMLAHGSKTWAWAYGLGDSVVWDQDGSNYSCNERVVAKEGIGCAGSILENNLKVIYK